jgi:hypothetical protein
VASRSTPSGSCSSPSSRQSQGLDPGSSVKRFGDRGAPVHDQGIELDIGHRQSTHVVGVAGALVLVEVVDTAKEEGLVPDGELVESLQGRSHHHVALDEVARTAHGRHGGRVT